MNNLEFNNKCDNYLEFRDKYKIEIEYRFSRKGTSDERFKRLHISYSGKELYRVLIKRPDVGKRYNHEDIWDEIKSSSESKALFYFNSINEKLGNEGFKEHDLDFQWLLIEDCFIDIISDVLYDFEEECKYLNGEYIGNKQIVFNANKNRYELV